MGRDLSSLAFPAGEKFAGFFVPENKKPLDLGRGCTSAKKVVSFLGG